MSSFASCPLATLTSMTCPQERNGRGAGRGQGAQQVHAEDALLGVLRRDRGDDGGGELVPCPANVGITRVTPSETTQVVVSHGGGSQSGLL